MNKIRSEKGEVTIDTTEIQRIVRRYYKQQFLQQFLYAKKLDNLGEMDKVLETYTLPKLNQEKAESLNRPITTSKIETVIKKLPAHQSPGADGFMGKFYQTSKELTPVLLNLSKNSRRGKTPKLFLQGSIILIPKPGKDTR